MAHHGRLMPRIEWIDHAKGICILLVVMLYGIGFAETPGSRDGWVHAVEAFARPFRMPDFFLVSGLLLARTLGRDWRTYLDRKVVHFAYFYVLWLTLLVGFESRWIAEESGWRAAGAFYLESFVNPYSMLWFIYLLPVFFVVTKLVHRVPAVLVWLVAAALQVLQPDTGVKVLDKFTAYFVFFYSGYLFAPQVFRLAELAVRHPYRAVAVLAGWAVLNAALTASGDAFLPGVSLAAGLVGAAAVVCVAALACRIRAFGALGYCGRHSIAIYLAFLIPMAVTHELATRAGMADVNALALAATAGGVAGALILERLVRDTRLAFLFKRPRFLTLKDDGFVRQLVAVARALRIVPR